MIRPTALALAGVLAAAAAAAQAQTYPIQPYQPPVPGAVRTLPPPVYGGAGQTQRNLNQFQSQIQADQLQRLQQQNIFTLQSADPAVQAQALARQQQIQRQIDQNTALQQHMLTPHANPADVNAQLQQNNVEIQRLQRLPPILPPATAP